MSVSKPSFKICWLDDQLDEQILVKNSRFSKLKDWMIKETQERFVKIADQSIDQKIMYFDTGQQGDTQLLTKGKLSITYKIEKEVKFSKFDLILLDIDFGPGKEQYGLQILNSLTKKLIADRSFKAKIIIFANVDIPEGSETIVNQGILLQVINKNSVMKYLDSLEKKKTPQMVNFWQVEQFRRCLDTQMSLKYQQFSRSLNSMVIDGDEVDAQLEAMANIGIDVLITGPSGTGKEVVFNKIVNNHKIDKDKVIAVNCAAISNELFDVEFFGCTDGAYTDAKARKGFCEAAHEGILFLDEVAELDIVNQAKLLRVLQERKLRRVGEYKESRPAKFILIAATNKDLEQEIIQGRFREDLYFRLATKVRIELKPLNQRDLVVAQNIVKSIFYKKCDDYKKTLSLSKELLDHFCSVNIKGNIRTLEGIIETMVALTDKSSELLIQDIPKRLQKFFTKN
ncbi:MAG: hypothetical protein COB02_18155 [Candidatus Cloacimonadota bacterium]|nr:MAG: hypothetical protein COB02_18155 [Candidatus Cloacimonadota bacterium]